MAGTPSKAISPPSPGGLIERLLAGETAALARAISLLDGDRQIAATIIRAVMPKAGAAQVVGFTGPPGAGKSTLISAYITELRAVGKRVAVVAVDPSSPLSGGAVLGDRTRMGAHYDDPDVFIRSVAARGHLGGLAANMHQITALIDAAGWDVVILETVGAGQSETEVAQLADTKVVVNAPGLGDDVQAIKAGILEIADILVVNKADLSGAARTVTQLNDMLRLRADGGAAVQVLRTVATEGEGLSELAAAVGAHLENNAGPDPALRLQHRARAIAAQAAAKQAQQLVAGIVSPPAEAIFAALAGGDLDADQAAKDLLKLALMDAD
jgi:LAO/AO transport system kinase